MRFLTSRMQRTEFVALDADSAKKLSQNNDLADQLLATDERVLEETNGWGDRFWGVVDGEGGDVLGKVLMDTHERLRRARAEGK